MSTANDDGPPTLAESPKTEVGNPDVAHDSQELGNVHESSIQDVYATDQSTNGAVESVEPQSSLGTGNGTSTSKSTISRPPYKSFRKKYRKLRRRFAIAMRENENLEEMSSSARQALRRLNGENGRLLDMLLDITRSSHIQPQLQIHGLDDSEDEIELERESKARDFIFTLRTTKIKQGIDKSEPDRLRYEASILSDDETAEAEDARFREEIADPVDLNDDGSFKVPDYLADEMDILQKEYESS
ncbi:IEC3 subunit of the Ino80 complex, chromatin re-modelling-domain-containing protein [Lipomyces oligophaga]|uniref:IEC3 subunit of the Ino80 complex, chromatin re-modelling-domain-containing protein n=1 Tax=Lipomyces oligophaga TaxID=45792 RepID=UPI0034CE76BE